MKTKAELSKMTKAQLLEYIDKVTPERMVGGIYDSPSDRMRYLVLKQEHAGLLVLSCDIDSGGFDLNRFDVDDCDADIKVGEMDIGIFSP